MTSDKYKHINNIIRSSSKYNKDDDMVTFELELRKKISAVEAAYIYHKFADQWTLIISDMLCFDARHTLIREYSPQTKEIINEYAREKNILYRADYGDDYTINYCSEKVSIADPIKFNRNRFNGLIRKKYRYSFAETEFKMFNIELTFVECDDNNISSEPITFTFDPYSVLKRRNKKKYTYEIEIELIPGIEPSTNIIFNLDSIIRKLYNCF